MSNIFYCIRFFTGILLYIVLLPLLVVISISIARNHTQQPDTEKITFLHVLRDMLLMVIYS